MRQIYEPLSDSEWLQFYITQAKQTGHGIPGFEGLPYQRGNGLGSFFRGLFRMILPVAKKVGKAVGREALATGANIASDLLKGQKFEESVKSRGKEGASNLLSKGATHLQQNQKGGRLGKRPARKRKGINVNGNAKKQILDLLSDDSSDF